MVGSTSQGCKIVKTNNDDRPLKNTPALAGRRKNALLSIILLLGLAFVPTWAEDYYQAAEEAGDDAAVVADDDDYIDLTGADFDNMAMMPVSCVN